MSADATVPSLDRDVYRWEHREADRLAAAETSDPQSAEQDRTAALSRLRPEHLKRYLQCAATAEVVDGVLHFQEYRFAYGDHHLERAGLFLASQIVGGAEHGRYVVSIPPGTTQEVIDGIAVRYALETEGRR